MRLEAGQFIEHKYLLIIILIYSIEFA